MLSLHVLFRRSAQDEFSPEGRGWLHNAAASCQHRASADGRAQPDPPRAAELLPQPHASPRGTRQGVCSRPRAEAHPSFRAHISTDSLPHPNPQPTLALGPVSSPRQQCLNQLLALEMAAKCFVSGRAKRGWSVDQSGQTNREEQDPPNGFFHFHPHSSTDSTECTWAHGGGGVGVRHHSIFHKLRNPQVAEMRGFSKTCQNTSTFPTTCCWGLALRAGQAQSHQLRAGKCWPET